MNIVIVGGGAIGRLFGAFLARGGHDLTLVDVDSEAVEAFKTKGVGLMANGEENQDEVILYPVQSYASGESIETCDLVLLLVKSQATLSAVKNIAHLISSSCPLLCIQTGLGNLEIIKNVIPEENVILGITFLSGTALGNNRVRQGGEGKTYIGELDGSYSARLERICQVFTHCGIISQMVRRIEGRLWCKVIVYSAINPVSTLLKIPNGCLKSKMESMTLMKRLLDEGKAVAQACSVELVYPDLYELLFDACEKSANNLSSMLQDILNERPTEIDAQNGAICRYADEQGITVPTHQTMVELIKLLECWKPGIEHL